LRDIAERHGLVLIADACHSIGAQFNGRNVGTLADLSVFSFHPVKHITTGEGGMVVTDETKFAEKMRRFRNHGIATDYKQREDQKTWFYEMVELGYNYRITDFQCALGLSQLKKLPSLLEKRRSIASHYDNAFASVSAIQPLSTQKHALHAYHLYVIKLNLKALGLSRKKLFQKMRNKGIGANVHYIPAHLHPYYRKNFGTYSNLCPIAEKVYEQIISIPIYPGMTDKDIKKVINVIIEK
jgi:perosamine synthetase